MVRGNYASIWVGWWLVVTLWIGWWLVTLWIGWWLVTVWIGWWLVTVWIGWWLVITLWIGWRSHGSNDSIRTGSQGGFKRSGWLRNFSSTCSFTIWTSLVRGNYASIWVGWGLVTTLWIRWRSHGSNDGIRTGSQGGFKRSGWLRNFSSTCSFTIWTCLVRGNYVSSWVGWWLVTTPWLPRCSLTIRSRNDGTGSLAFGISSNTGSFTLRFRWNS